MKVTNKITMIHGDCMDYMAGLEDGAFELAIVDPPYGIGEDGKKNHSRGRLAKATMYIAKSWDKETPKTMYFDELFRVSKNQIIWGVNNLEYCYRSTVWPGRIFWDKVNGSNDFSDGELAYCSFHKSIRLFRYMWNGMMQGKSVTEGYIHQPNKKLNERRIHPTQKPVALYKWLLTNYAKPGDRILDTHGGSGSIAIACHDFGFELVWIEKDEDYYNAAVQRVKQHTAQLQMF